MKTLIFAAIRCSLMFTAVAALSVAYPAKATMFDVSGTCTPGTGFTGTTFSGTLTIDVTAGTVTGIHVSFQGLSAFTSIAFPLQILGHLNGRSLQTTPRSL